MSKNEHTIYDVARKIRTTKTNAKIILDDLRKLKQQTSFFHKYDKQDIIRWLDNPSYYSDKLIEVSNYFYVISNHYRRLVKYFSDISLFCYMLIPNEKSDKKNINEDNYKKYASIIKNIGQESKQL